MWRIADSTRLLTLIGSGLNVLVDSFISISFNKKIPYNRTFLSPNSSSNVNFLQAANINNRRHSYIELEASHSGNTDPYRVALDNGYICSQRWSLEYIQSKEIKHTFSPRGDLRSLSMSAPSKL